MAHPYHQKQRFTAQEVELARCVESLLAYYKQHIAEHRPEADSYHAVSCAVSALYGNPFPYWTEWFEAVRDHKYVIKEGVHWTHAEAN